MEKFISTCNRSPESNLDLAQLPPGGAAMLLYNSRGRIRIALGNSVMVPPGISGYVQGTAEVMRSWSLSTSQHCVCLEFAFFSGRPFLRSSFGSPASLFYQLYNLRTSPCSEDTAKSPQLSLVDLAGVRCSPQTVDHFWEYLNLLTHHPFPVLLVKVP